MNLAILALALLGLALLATGSGILGYHLAVARTRRQRREMAIQITTLEQRMADLNAEIADDPQRAWIDHGQRYVINQIESTLRTIRAQMEA